MAKSKSKPKAKPKAKPKVKSKPKTKAVAKRKPRLTYRTVEIQGEKHKVVKLTRGRDVPQAEKVKISILICQMYETDEYTLEECSQAVGITSKTFFNWTRNISEISDLYTSSDSKKTELYKHKLKERARTQAERLIDGYTVELKSMEQTKDANGKKTGSKMQVKTVLVKPSVKLIETVLFSVDDKVFKKPAVPIEGLVPGSTTNITNNIVLKYDPQEIDVPLITSESEMEEFADFELLEDDED